MSNRKPATIADLRASGRARESAKEELRRNLLVRLRSGQEVFPGIVGYEDTVIPQICNALISGHDLILLGERGQAKSRIMRSLVGLLDEEVPVIPGCEINDHPYAPICRRCRDLVAEHGDETEIGWREARDARHLDR